MEEPLEAWASKFVDAASTLCLCVAAAATIAAQTSSDFPDIPSNFNLDMQTAARLRPQLIAASVPASGRFATGALVFANLIHEARPSLDRRFSWQLRIVEDGEFNAYASPDGTVYVETGLAHLAGQTAGLWAAILSHEIAHVIRRDWARRYLYQKSVTNNASAAIMLGDPGLPSASWTDSSKASQDLGRFCRQLEIDADRDGLMLMARAGYHPDFMPALHHLLHAAASAKVKPSLYAMHPCWEERDRELSRAYLAASIEFAHRGLEWYASPGGNPPVLVFAEEPTVRRKDSGMWEVQLPMRCQNLVGAVEVVIENDPSALSERLTQTDQRQSPSEVRQLTGCTSPRTTVSFTLTSTRQQSGTRGPEIYVLDVWGGVLARADVPTLH